MPDEKQGLHVPSSFNEERDETHPQDDAPVMAERIARERIAREALEARESAEESGYDFPAPGEQPPESKEEEMWSTVFIVGVDKTGVAFVAENVEEFLDGKRFDHMATPPEMLAAVRQIKGDIEASQIASQVMRGMQMVGQMMAQQAEAQKIAQGAGFTGMPMNREQRRRQR